MPAARKPSRVWPSTIAALASLLLVLGLLAGAVNRNVVDGSRFAAHVDAVRQDPAVARQVGQAITDRLLTVAPDLVAVRPLIDAAATSLVGSPSFGPAVRLAATQLHRAFTDESTGQVLLRLADVGAVLASVLKVVAPNVAGRIPANLDVTLARVGEQTFAARTMHAARVVRVLSWALPLLALVLLGCGIWLSPVRLRGVGRAGWALVGVGAIIGALTLLGSLVASRADEGTLRGALTAGTWRSFAGGFWWLAALPALAGTVLVTVTADGPRQRDPDLRAQSLLDALVRPSGRWRRLGAGSALTVLGLLALVRPVALLAVLGVSVGLLAFSLGVRNIASAASAAGSGPGTEADRRTAVGRSSVVVAVLAASAVLVALVVVDARPADTRVDTTAATAATACNGHVQLCSRPYNDVAFAATHNSMSAADEPGWFIPEQPDGLLGQLDAGVRVMLIDSWYGQPTQRPNLVATAPGSHAAALAEAEQQFGRASVDSAIRTARAISPRPTGPPRPYLCHGLCEIGSTEWAPVMTRVREWLTAHPREVVTFFIEDSVSPTDTADVFRQAGLLPMVHTQVAGQPWPTLGQMIDSGRRVVVLMERHSGGTSYPWLLPGFQLTQDTPYSNATQQDLSCAPNRGSPSSPLLLINDWLANHFTSLVTDARQINAYDVMWPYVARCREERGRIPNFVAVNFYDEGDLFRVIDKLNGV